MYDLLVMEMEGGKTWASKWNEVAQGAALLSSLIMLIPPTQLPVH